MLDRAATQWDCRKDSKMKFMLKPTASRLRRESGMAIIVTAIMLTFLIPMVGLAVDGGVMFIVRARLEAALDSAALAAGRGLNTGTTQALAETAATTSAVNFLLANFPSGYLNTSYAGTKSNNYGVVASFTPNSIGTVAITITAKVLAPTYFMKWLSYGSIPISATGQATRPSLVIVLVLDKSSSMGTRDSPVGTMPASVNYSTASSCEAMVYNANAFTQNFSPFDTVAEISFDATVTVDYAPSSNFRSTGSTGVSAAIANIQCGSNTNTTGALAQAAAVINYVNQPAALNHIVLFTDGVANGVNAKFPVRTSASLLGRLITGWGRGRRFARAARPRDNRQQHRLRGYQRPKSVRHDHLRHLRHDHHGRDHAGERILGHWRQHEHVSGVQPSLPVHLYQQQRRSGASRPHRVHRRELQQLQQPGRRADEPRLYSRHGPLREQHVLAMGHHHLGRHYRTG